MLLMLRRLFLLVEQGEDLNQSEANTGSAAINIEEGVTQVKLVRESSLYCCGFWILQFD
jgi:hypothetical protein